MTYVVVIPSKDITMTTTSWRYHIRILQHHSRYRHCHISWQYMESLQTLVLRNCLFAITKCGCNKHYRNSTSCCYYYSCNTNARCECHPLSCHRLLRQTNVIAIFQNGVAIPYCIGCTCNASQRYILVAIAQYCNKNTYIATFFSRGARVFLL